MPNKTKDIKYFDAVQYLTLKYEPVQQVIEKIVNLPNVIQLILTGCRQFGKSWWAYRHLIEDIVANVDKNYAIIIPLDTELERFLSEQLTKPFGLDENGRKCTSIESVRIPMKTESGYHFKRLVTKFDRGDVPQITFFNGCKLFFFAGNANPEQHIPGNTFRLIIQDEWAKFTKDITRIIQSTLLHENGKLICTTTLNEKDPTNWFATKILKDYKEKGARIIPKSFDQLCGLDVYKKEVKANLEIMDQAGNIHATNVEGKSVLIVGDFESIYPWVHHGQDLYQRVMTEKALGILTEDDYQVLYRCNPSVRNLQILSNYNPDVNLLDISDVKDIDERFPIQLIGYDHGSGKSIDNRCAIGWARVACITDPLRPNFEQYIILESGNLFDEDANTENVAVFLDEFNLPVATDPSIFHQKWSGIHEKPDVFRFFRYAPNLQKKIFPASGAKLNNSSRDRVTFWQKALLPSKSIEESIKISKQLNVEFDTANYIEYSNPLDSSLPGCQIYIAIDKYQPQLNVQLIEEIETWKKRQNKAGDFVEPIRAKIDTWDSGSLGILGFQRNKNLIMNFYNKKPKVTQERKQIGIKQHTVVPKGMSIMSLNNNFS